MLSRFGLGLGGVTRGQGGAWWLSGSVLDLDFANRRGYNSIATTASTPDSILTYTSPSPKMVYGDDGVLGYAPHNLLTYAEQFDNAAWTPTSTTLTANAATAPNGTTTADRLIEDTATTSHVIVPSSPPSVVSGTVYTGSVYLKKGIGATAPNLVQLTFQSAGFGAAQYANFNLNTGAVGAVSGATSSIQSVGNGWYRCSITATASASTTAGLAVVFTNNADAARTPAYAGVVTSDVYLWGAQLNRGSSALTYVPTTSAAVYSPPIDHDPITLAALGVLIEEQRTNLLTYSEQFDNAAWTKSRSTATANQAAAPDGATTADKCAEDNTTGVHEIFNASGITLTAAAYTASIFLKSAERTKARLTLSTGGGALGARVIVDLSAGTLAAVENLGAHTGGTATIQALPDGWYRVSLIITGTAASYFVALSLVTGTSTTSYEGTTGSGVLVWGAQLEAGSFPTSLVPTVASQVTRAADQVSILTSAFAYNAAEGTVLFTGYLPSNVDGASGNYFYSISDGTTSNSIHVIDSGTIRSQIVTAGVLQLDSSIGSEPVTGALISAALGFAANDVRAARGGTLGVLDTVATMPSGINILRVGARADLFSITYLNGHIKRLTYFPTRRTDADLQVLST